MIIHLNEAQPIHQLGHCAIKPRSAGYVKRLALCKGNTYRLTMHMQGQMKNQSGLAEWARRLETFICVGKEDDSIREAMLNSCPDPDTRFFCETLPNLDAKAILIGESLQLKLLSQQNVIESFVINIALLAPKLTKAAQSVLGAPKVREEGMSLLQSILKECKTKNPSSPTQYLLSSFLYKAYLRAGLYYQARTPLADALYLSRKFLRLEGVCYQVALADTLGNLAVYHSLQKQNHRACLTYNHAVKIHKKILERTRTDTAKEAFAQLLSNYGANLRELGRLDACISELKRACALREEIASNLDEKSNYNVGMTLSSLATAYHSRREHTLSKLTFTKSIGYLRKAETLSPGQYRAELAMTLNNQGILFKETRQFDQALEAYEEAEKIYSELKIRNESLYTTPHLKVINNIGALYKEMNETDEAIKYYERVVGERHKLVREAPNIHTPDLANTLNNLGNSYKAKGLSDQATKAYKEALAMRHKLSTDDFIRHGLDYTVTLMNVGNERWAKGDHKRAITLYSRATRLRRRLARQDSKTNGLWLAQSLSHLSVAKKGVDYAKEAIEWVEKYDDIEFLYLAKGMAHEAYCMLLSENADNFLQSFAIAASQRSLFLRAKDIVNDSLVSAQRELPENTIIIVADHNPLNNVNSFGLIAGDECIWTVSGNACWQNLMGYLSEYKTVEDVENAARQCMNEFPDKFIFYIVNTINKGGEIFIAGGTYWTSFPWELLQLEGRVNNPLGLVTALPRIRGIVAQEIRSILKRVPNDNTQLKAVLFGAHTTGREPLHGVESEYHDVLEGLSSLEVEVVSTKLGEDARLSAWLDALRHEPDIIYFTGHGEVFNDKEYLILHRDISDPKPWGKAYFGPGDIERRKHTDGLMLKEGCAIILNACRTGRTHGYGGKWEDLVAGFLEQGAGFVLSTDMMLHDSVGEVIGNCLTGRNRMRAKTIGKLVPAIRSEVYKKFSGSQNPLDTMAWCRIHLHGNAFWSHPQLSV